MPQEASGSRSSLTINTTSAWRTGAKVTRGHRCARATPADGSRVARQRHDSRLAAAPIALMVTSGRINRCSSNAFPHFVPLAVQLRIRIALNGDLIRERLADQAGRTGIRELDGFPVSRSTECVGSAMVKNDVARGRIALRDRPRRLRENLSPHANSRRNAWSV